MTSRITKRAVKPTLKRQRVTAHKLIANTAEQMAGAVYEELMKNNTWYAAWQERHPDLSGTALQHEFIRVTAPGMTRQARATLAQMLRNPAYSHLHDQIAEALILDNSFVRQTGKNPFDPRNYPGGKLPQA